jgi:phosphonate transport system permease protein
MNRLGAAEIIEEADLAAVRLLRAGIGTVSAFLYARLPEVAGRMRDDTLYRLECGLRSSLVLGFIGLPTMRFSFESAFRQGRYAEAGALLLIFDVLIGTRRLWVRARTVALLLAGAVLALPLAIGSAAVGPSLARLLGHDIVPAPLRGASLAEPET